MDNWRIGWLVGDNLLGFREVCKMYEDAYFNFLSKKLDLLDKLINEAANIYVYDPSDVNSGLDYLKKGDKQTHIHDIAIRSCLERLGKKFKGSMLIPLNKRRGQHPLNDFFSW